MSCLSAPAFSRLHLKTLAVVLPVLFEGQVKAIIEIGSVSAFTDLQVSFLDQLTATIGIVLNSIEATMQTEGLLKQSQELAAELQIRQKELQQTNEQLEQKAQQLAERNVEVERRTRRSNRLAARLKRRPPNWRWRQNINPTFWPTCRTNCGLRLIASSFSVSSSVKILTAT